jgi:hypothetical protein
MRSRWGRVAALAAAVMAVALAAATTATAESPALRAAAAPAHELDGTSTVTLPGGAVVQRFRQRVGGTPVLGAEAVTNRPPGSDAELLADTTHPRIAPPGPARVARERAIAAAQASVGADALRDPVSARLAIRPGAGGSLVWRVLVPAARPLGDFEVLVDANTGAVVSQRDILREFRTGAAKLYRVNPVVQNGGARHLTSDHDDRNTPLLRKLRRLVKLPNIDDGQNCLAGRWVHALRGRDQRETCKPNVRWKQVTRADNRFEALMAYYQVNRSQRYIQSLGFSDSNPSPNGVADRVQRVVADAYPLDNSAYSPITQAITYGWGGVDDAEDGDVIVHEYAHAMQDAQSPSFGRSGRYDPVALAEGSSDYWAAVMSARAPHTSNEDDVCIFDWDATTYGKLFPRVAPERSARRCGRRADVTRTVAEAKAHCPRVLFGSRFAPDPHCVGEVWSSGLWDVRRALVAANRASGRQMDRVYLAAQFLYTGKETFGRAGNALLCADEDLYPQGRAGDCRGEHYSVIHRELQRRGVVR